MDIEKILGSTIFCKAAGIDDLSGRFLEDGPRVSSKPISGLCNLSIKLGSFPTAFPKPLFKKGSKTNPLNYRPMSLLPLVSKTIETLIHEQTSSFFYPTMKLYTIINQEFGKTTRQTHVTCFSMIKF